MQDACGAINAELCTKDQAGATTSWTVSENPLPPPRLPPPRPPSPRPPKPPSPRPPSPPPPGAPYYISTPGREQCQYRGYLSTKACSSSQDVVDEWPVLDGSGRQQWRLVLPPGAAYPALGGGPVYLQACSPLFQVLCLHASCEWSCLLNAPSASKIHSSCPLPLQSVGRAPPLGSCASFATGPAGCAQATTVLSVAANATTAWVLEPASGTGRWYFRLQASTQRISAAVLVTAPPPPSAIRTQITVSVNGL